MNQFLSFDLIFLVSEFLDSLSDIGHLLLMISSENNTHFSWKGKNSQLAEFYWKTLLSNVLMSYIEHFVGRVRSENDLKKIREIKKKGLEHYYQCAEIVLKSSKRKKLSSLELKVEEMMERYYVKVLREQFGEDANFDISECLKLLTTKRKEALYNRFFYVILNNNRHDKFMESLISLTIVGKSRFKCYEKDMLKALIRSKDLENISNSNSETITTILLENIEQKKEYGNILPDIIKLLKLKLSITQVAKLYRYLAGSDILDTIQIDKNLEVMSIAFDIILKSCSKNRTVEDIQSFKMLVMKHDPSSMIWNHLKEEENRLVENQELIQAGNNLQFIDSLFNVLEIQSINIRTFKFSNVRFLLLDFLKSKNFKLDRNDVLSFLFTPTPDYLFTDYMNFYNYCKKELNFNIYEEIESNSLICTFFKFWRTISAKEFFEAVMPNEPVFVEKISNINSFKDSVAIHLDSIYYSWNQPQLIVEYLFKKFQPSIFDMDLLEKMLDRKYYALDSYNSDYLCVYILPLTKIGHVDSFQERAISLLSNKKNNTFKDTLYSNYPKNSDEFIMALYLACTNMKK